MSLNDYKSYESAIERGPVSAFLKFGGLMLFAAAVVAVVGYGLGWLGEGAKVAQEQFGPKAALAKYEWFIDQANRIDKMDQDIKLFEGRVSGIDDQYTAYGKPDAWTPDVRLQYNQAKQQGRDDLLAIVSQRNNQVREYNAASGKFNWSLFKTRPDKPAERFSEYSTVN